MKKSHFIPDVLHPKLTPLPEAGAAVPASSLQLLKRQRHSKETYIVSANLVGLSQEKKKTKQKKKRHKPKRLSITLGKPAWDTTRDFVKWQNKVFKAELDKQQFDPLAEPLEREILNATVLRIRGSKVEKPESTLNYDTLQILIGDIKNQERIERARSRIRGANAEMQTASMDVLKQIANDRIAKFGCQEPGLVTDKQVLKFLKTKPRPKTPRVINYKTTHMDVLAEQRRLAAEALRDVDVDLDEEDDEEDTSGPFLTQISRSRTQLIEN